MAVNIEDRELYRTIVDSLCEGVVVVDRARRVLYWSPSAERITGYSSADVLGEKSCCGCIAHWDEAGEPLGRDRCPLARTLADGVPREERVYLRHKDGHRVPVCIRPVPIRNEAGEIAGALETIVETFTPPGRVHSVVGLK